METLLDLEQLGARLKSVDIMLMALVKRRMDLALQVGLYKRREGQKIFRAEVEDKRIAEVKGWAAQHDLNPSFAATLLYLLIGESCKLQMIQLQEESLNIAETETDDERYGRLKRNLLLLTERCCDSYDSNYEQHAFATRAYLQFERAAMEREIQCLTDRETVIDLGCATGRLTFSLSERFVHAIGYDLSPHLIATARKNAKQHAFGSRTSFEEIDIEKGIPINDSTASFVVMNLGTGSDVRNISGVITETLRVLKPGGRFFFSFYNRDALLYRWDFLPWTVGLVASVNPHRHCLEVHLQNEVLSVYARPYSVAEVSALFRDACGREVSLSTYPTMSSILPDELFDSQPDMQQTIADLDANLSASSMGAYIIATGQK